MDLRTKETITTIAPGRVCLFGDHQDYLGLPIIASAIDRHISLKAKKNNSKVFNIYKPDIDTKESIAIDAVNENTNVIGDHFLAALKVVQRHGCIPTEGYDITITGNIAINAGISSSSAVLMTWVKFLLEAFCDKETDGELAAEIAYQAEVIEQKSSGGKMDQYSIGLGNIIYLETDVESSYERIEKPLEGLIVGESGIPKKTLALLKELKEKSWLAISKVKEKLPDFTVKRAKIEELDNYLNYVEDDLKPYLYAAISNYNVTKNAQKEFAKETLDLKKIGELINEHHVILRDSLKITLPKIDNMINAALDSGAYGAKIVGSGKGGCIVALSPPGKEKAIIKAIKDAGGKDAYSVSIDPGVRVA
ncbi:MAG: galactokinase [Flavobacteriaceae bacterium]|nr:galactokinase [Flavobacteriaceae bacterium]